MSHSLVGDDRRLGAQLSRIKAKPARNRSARSRVNGFFAAVIEAIAAAKLRRLQRELALGGVSYPLPEQDRRLPK
jgi:hypothetical protein